ncbi:MAG: hypothetical protein V1800_00535 [Candidatus Latescibacterota bacterium]
MRKLIHIPIIHTADDFGSLASLVKDEYGRVYGRQKWQEHLKAIEDRWRLIQEKVMHLDLEWERVRLYQDGLPVCGKEQEIAHKIAADGNINYELLCHLVKMGGLLEGTEDPQLLQQEYRYILEIGQAKNLDQRDRLIEEYSSAGEKLLSERDRFIAKTIDQTLRRGETGVLFLGAMHKIAEVLSEDIEIELFE